MHLPVSTSPMRFGLGYSLFCPCVGDGATFAELAADIRERSGAPVRVYACEIDRTRWRKAGPTLRRVDRSATVLRGDANRLAWPATGDAVDLLYLDPPRNGHEVGWLKRFTPALAKTGALALVVRAEQLARQERDKSTLASYLATAYLDHALFRLPDGRVLVVAGKSVTNRHTAREENRIAAAARAPGQLPVPADATGALTLIASDRQFRLHLRAVSVESALQQWQPLADAGVGLEEVDAGRAFGNVYPTAMPPKPAHIALALASGQFNGHELQPNETAPATWPPVVLKGSYARTRFTVQVDNGKDGKPKRITEADRPSFTMRAIALDDYRVIAPQDSAALTGTANLDEASVADVVEHYSEALGALMASQFPALHDPGNPEHAFELPSTSDLRTPYPCQESRIRAALKLIAKGQNPKLMEDVGVGKCLAAGTEVLMHDGSVKAVEEVVAGDLLMGPDSRPRTVLRTGTGNGRLYSIVPVKGSRWVCNEHHILTVIVSGFGREPVDIPLDQFLSMPRCGRVRHNAKLIRSGVSLPEKELPVSPYFLGLWVGDGTIGQPAITAGEPEIIKEIEAEAQRLGLAVTRKAGNNTYTHYLGKKDLSRRFVKTPLRSMVKTWSVAGEKVIPHDYMTSSTEQRLELLAGIVDTDGYMSSGCFEVISKWKNLAEQYCFLARSLGLAASISEKIGTIKSLNFSATYYRVIISGEISRVPCRLPSKQAASRKQRKDVLVTGFSVEPAGTGQFYGFTLDGDGRFLLGDFTVTHNSLQSITAAACLSPQHHASTQRALRTVPGWEHAKLPTVRRVLVVCPPHMVSTWQEESALAWPSARVVQLDRMGDEHQDAEIYLVTKERAKLGHGEEEATIVWGMLRRGANSRVFGPLGSRLRSPAMRPDVHPRCPRCNTIPPPGAKRCKHSERVPTNDFARILPRLALALLPSLPQELTIREVAGRHRIALFAADRQKGMVRPPRAGEAAAIIRLLLAASMVAFDVRGSGWDEIFVAVRSLALAAGIREEAARALRETAAEIDRTQSAREDGHPGRWVQKQADLMPQWPREEISGHARTCWDIVRKLAEWEREPAPECGESLVQAVPSPRRYPLASHLLKKARRRFDLVILDEAHEAANSGTQQQLAMHRLAMLPCPTILLSGTMMTGYASSLWETWWASDADFRAAYGRRGKGAFLRQFGLRRHRKERPAKVVAGQPWPEKAVGEEPSVVPSFILRHVLPTAVLLHKSDLDSDLPPLREHPAPLTGGEDHRDRELLAAADELAVAVADRIEEDAGTELEGMLWGAMGEVTSYLDRCHAPFEVRYPESVGGEVVATGKLFDPSYIAPKERYLIHLLRRLVLREDRKVLVYLRHVGGHLPERLAGLIRQHVDPAGAYLSSKSPPPAKRRERIEEMLADGARWIVVNPEAVQTGLNCLVACSATVWMEPPRGTAKTWVQANGRVHRIGQTRPVDCYLPFYQGSIQEVSVPHVARKISAIQRVNGQSMQAALEAAGAGVDEREAAEAAMRFGRAVFERVMDQRTRERRRA